MIPTKAIVKYNWNLFPGTIWKIFIMYVSPNTVNVIFVFKNYIKKLNIVSPKLINIVEKIPTSRDKINEVANE